MATNLLALVGAMRRHFAHAAGSTPEVAAEAAKVLSALDTPSRPTTAAAPGNHPVLRHIEALGADAGDLLEGTLAPQAAVLPWRYGYHPRPDAPGLENEMAWAELVGPAAPVFSDSVGFGLTLIGPHTYYPAHHHPAVELYAVVRGTAIWTAAGRSGEQPPGSFILHPSNVVHAMRTAGQALLAIYSWTGDILTPSAYD
jgi:quercetin dioxygenase-like cupin family protein